MGPTKSAIMTVCQSGILAMFNLLSAISAFPTTTESNFFYESDEFNEFYNTDGKQNIRPPEGHTDGPMPTISDSVFSLIILIYVSVIFIFMFFSFCWKQPTPPPPDPAHKNLPMITSILEEMERQQQKQVHEEEFHYRQEGVVSSDEKEELRDEGEGLEMQEKPLIGGERIVVNVVTEKNIDTIKEEEV